MPGERVEYLLNLLKNDPKDAFTKYALALEYQKNDKETAGTLFEELLLEQPDYLPTYYQAAHLFIELDELEKAKEIFEEGIKRSTKDLKNQAELRNAYQNFLFEYDLD